MEYWKNLSLENIEGETWASTPGLVGHYEVSTYGRVKSVKNTPKILRQIDRGNGYLCVCLSVMGKCRNESVHTLVIRTFSGVIIPKNKRFKIVVNHKDTIKTNNMYSNLEYISSSGNSRHAISMGLWNPEGVNNYNAKLTENDVRFIRNNPDIKRRFLAKKYNVSGVTIWHVRKGTKYASVI